MNNIAEQLEEIEIRRQRLEELVENILGHRASVEIAIWDADDLMNDVPDWYPLQSENCFTLNYPATHRTSLFSTGVRRAEAEAVK